VIPLCNVSDVPPGEGRAVTVAGRRIALFHAESGWFALDNACPHRGGPLADGILSDRCVTCPLHERRFDLATGAALTDGGGVTAYRIELRGQAVMIDLVPAAPREPLLGELRESEGAACPATG
jgi:nitrite reductase (NADH) small subunit